MNELEQLLSMLGSASFAEAAATITNLNAAIDGVKSATGKGTAQEAISELTARAARAPFALAVEKATGKTGDEAIGLIHAALASHVELPKAQARVTELEMTTSEQAFNSLVAKAKDEKRLTPAQETAARAAFASGELTLKSAEFFFANLSVNSLLQTPPTPGTPETVVTPASAQLWNGKTYAQLSGPERAALNKENPDLFKQMRAGFKPARAN